MIENPPLLKSMEKILLTFQGPKGPYIQFTVHLVEIRKYWYSTYPEFWGQFCAMQKSLLNLNLKILKKKQIFYNFEAHKILQFFCLFSVHVLACEISNWVNHTKKNGLFSKSKYHFLYSWLLSLEPQWKEEWASIRDSHSFRIFRTNHSSQWTWCENMAKKAREEKCLRVPCSSVVKVEKQWKKQATSRRERSVVSRQRQSWRTTFNLWFYGKASMSWWVGSRLQSIAEVATTSVCLIFHTISPNIFGFISTKAKVTNSYPEKNDGGNKMIVEESNYFAYSWHTRQD